MLHKLKKIAITGKGGFWGPFFLFMLVLQGLSASGRRQTDTIVNILGIKGPSGIAMIKMFENPPKIEGYEIRIEALSQADLISGRLISGEAQFGMLPPNIAAKIASQGINLQTVAVTGTGMLSLLSSDPAVSSLESLAGKRIEIANAGAVPDYILRRLLLDRGLNPEKDLVLSYSLSSPEIAASLISGRISTALLPEPFASMVLSSSSSVRRIGNIQDEWRGTYGGEYPITVMAVNGKFAEDHPAAVNAILASIEDSIRWVIANTAEAGILAEKHGMGISAQIAGLAIPASNYRYIPADRARPELEALFKVLYDLNPQSVGRMPEEKFYYRAAH